MDLADSLYTLGAVCLLIYLAKFLMDFISGFCHRHIVMLAMMLVRKHEVIR